MKQEKFVDVELGFSPQNLNLLNKAVDAFAEFDSLVARALHLQKEQSWPREFTLATIAYYLLHRHRNEYHGEDANPDLVLRPVSITVQADPETTRTMGELMELLESHPPIAKPANGGPELCALCGNPLPQGHTTQCAFDRALGEAQRLLRSA